MKLSRLSLLVLAVAAALITSLSAASAEAAGYKTKVPKHWTIKASKVAVKYWRKKEPKRYVCKPAWVSYKITNRKPNGHWATAPIDVCHPGATRKAQIQVWRKAAQHGWKSFCTLMIHEWGHLIGLYHVNRPNKVMSPTVTAKAHVGKCGSPPSKKIKRPRGKRPAPTIPAAWTDKANRVAAKFWKAKKPNRAICAPKQVRYKITNRKPNGHWATAPIDVCRADAAREPLITVWRKAGQNGWDSFCTLMVHEWGHLIGLEHSSKPSNVMYPTVSSKSYVKQCGHPPIKKVKKAAKKKAQNGKLKKLLG